MFSMVPGNSSFLVCFGFWRKRIRALPTPQLHSVRAGSGELLQALLTAIHSAKGVCRGGRLAALRMRRRHAENLSGIQTNLELVA
jgi:hypothetical protein